MKEDKKMNKPITIIRAEFISNLANLINDSRLPAFVIESILKDTYLEVGAIARKQYEDDMKKYKEMND